VLTRDDGISCTRSPAESYPVTANFGGLSPVKSSGLVVSMTTLPRKVSGPALRSALSFATPSVARTTISPLDAASANVPTDACAPIVSDIHLPNGDGVAFAQAVRAGV
jgi:hypothetical protein